MRALLVALAALILAGAAGAATQPRVLAITFGPDLEINPVTQGYLTHQLSRAASDHYDAAVILLDTPGGLSTSMKTIYNAELNAKLPVIVYVSPNGARAASAGVWVSQAADVLAMAPTTNIGSSTPIEGNGQNLGSDLRRKVINDAVASLTALAAAHHRNVTWPAKAVRVASNLTADQALRMNVIDTIAPTLPALLRQLDGYRTKDAQRPYTLHLAGAHIDTVKPGFVTRLLNTFIDPNLISILFLAGIVGLIFEVLHPGVVLPGALGAVSLVIALYGFSVLNPSWGGVALILLGVALLVIDLHAMTHGALTVGGLIALGFGMALLFQNEPAGYHVNTWLIVGLGSAIGAFWTFALGKGFAARRLPVTVGPQAIVGKTGEVRAPGLVFVNGELWQAHAEDDSELVPGEQVEVEAIHGLRLTVRR
ncbi:MAG TPA: nodulation protein NfeD [Gaiellaceae bacterium]|nr:nodulation protein NfeD [Gaiellaceae bacterium]